MPQDFKDENDGMKLTRKCCGQTEEMEIRCSSTDITTEKTLETVTSLQNTMMQTAPAMFLGKPNGEETLLTDT
jgi:hypothetical protein